MGHNLPHREEVGLVEDVDAGQISRPQLPDEVLHHLRLLLPPRVGDVDDVQQQIGILQLLQGGLEGLHQLMGELADKSHGVADHHVQSVADGELAGCGVQRVEEAVVGGDGRPGKLIEEGGLPGVGVAHDGHHRDLILLPELALGGPHPADLLQIPADLVDLLVDQAAVGLQLGLAGALGADGPLAAAAALAFQVGPHTGKPGQQVLVLRQFHLQPALLGLGPLGEDVQNQAAAVQHLDPQHLREHPLLGGGQVVVKDHHVSPGILAEELHLRRLPLADKAAGVRGRPVLQHSAHRLSPGGLHQGGQLRHALLVGVLLPLQNRGVEAHQNHFVANSIHIPKVLLTFGYRRYTSTTRPI